VHSFAAFRLASTSVRDIGASTPQMNEAAIQTMDSLRYLGFEPDPTVISDGTPGLSFNFGNLKLNASSCLKSAGRGNSSFRWRSINVAHSGRSAL